MAPAATSGRSAFRLQEPRLQRFAWLPVSERTDYVYLVHWKQNLAITVLVNVWMGLPDAFRMLTWICDASTFLARSRAALVSLSLGRIAG